MMGGDHQKVGQMHFHQLLYKNAIKEINFQPNSPTNETLESMEAQRVRICEEMRKSNPDWLIVNQYMNSSYAFRRKDLVGGLMIKDALERWPAVFCAKQVCFVIQFVLPQFQESVNRLYFKLQS
jgi:GH35 family endo-1,4-beta-xylanase